MATVKSLKTVNLWRYFWAVTLLFTLLGDFEPVLAEASGNDFLTKEERQWLAEHPVLRLGVGISFPPYQWVSKEKGQNEFKGVVSDYLRILEDRLQVKMEIVHGIKFDQALALGRKREIDLFPCLAATPEREEFLLFSQPYIDYPTVIITREDESFVGKLEDLSGRKVSAVAGQVLHSLLIKDYAELNLQIVTTENAEKDLQAVSFGLVDACFMDLGVASYLIQKLHLTNLKVAAPMELAKVELAMGVRKDWPILQGIIDKALQTVTVAERNAINQRWIHLKYDPGIALEQVLLWGGGISCGTLLFFTLLFLWNRRLQREIAERKKIEKERSELIVELTLALSEVKTLQGFLPICAHCKKIRDDSGYWQQIESYIQTHTDTKFSHGICPDCVNELYPDFAAHNTAPATNHYSELSLHKKPHNFL